MKPIIVSPDIFAISKMTFIVSTTTHYSPATTGMYTISSGISFWYRSLINP